jgi:hypothetical protein
MEKEALMRTQGSDRFVVQGNYIPIWRTFPAGVNCPWAMRIFLLETKDSWGSSLKAFLASRQIHHWVSSIDQRG